MRRIVIEKKSTNIHQVPASCLAFCQVQNLSKTHQCIYRFQYSEKCNMADETIQITHLGKMALNAAIT